MALMVRATAGNCNLTPVFIVFMVVPMARASRQSEKMPKSAGRLTRAAGPGDPIGMSWRRA
jgi:hypothetical protein